MLHKISLSLFLFFLSTNVMAQCDSGLPEQGARDDVLVIVNDNSKDSCEVGRYYAEQRGLGKNNMLHVRSPANYFIVLKDFKILRDQIIQQMQQRIVARDPSFIPVTCTDGDIPFYCRASMDQLRANTSIRYLVTTKGIPTRFRFDGSTLPPVKFALLPTSVDNYLKYWLINYFSKDTAFTARSRNRARAFGDGRNIRTVDPKNDRELIIGRIDGITLESAKALIDRTHAAEANGFFGKVYSYTSQGTHESSTGMRWKDYSQGNSDIYDGTGSPWRYPFGIFGETSTECANQTSPDFYLNFASNDSRGKTAPSCAVKFKQARSTEPGPGQPRSRQPLADDAIFYNGFLDGQAAGKGNFNAFLNWRRDTSCNNTLCENLALGEQAACRQASTDVYKEIDTRCVGVADGFVGYNFISYPVSFFHIAPTGWNTGTTEGFKIGRPIVRENSGFDDSMSLWYRNNEVISTPSCYTDSDFSQPANGPCDASLLISFSQSVRLASVQTSDALAPDQYRLRFKYKAENLNRAIFIKASIKIKEKGTNKEVTYQRINAGPAVIANTITEWLDGEAIITFDHTDSQHNANWDGRYQSITITLESNRAFSGAIGIDNVTLERLDPAAVAAPVVIALKNPSFTQGHKQTTKGDHAANFLSRLNGVGFWGSLSHHESVGHSFDLHTLETMVYFMRGLPLGDAVWFAERRNSGILYGDPLYSPVAIKLDDINRPFNFILGNVSLQGSTINGKDASLVNTTYQIDYCKGKDFYDCDIQSSWQSTGLNGTGGQKYTPMGVWNTTGLGNGWHTLRLGVTSVNQATGRSQTYYDFYPVVLVDQSSDFDNDGVIDMTELARRMDPTSTDTDGDRLDDALEIELGTDPTSPFSDNDTLTDGQEVLDFKTNPKSEDTDNDGMPDGWEVRFSGLNPLFDDAVLDYDNDGLNNLGEFLNATLADKPDSDFDGINDGEEVDNNTDPNSRLDRDLDGMSDDWESIRGTNVQRDDGGVDADGDGVLNIIEFARNTDPLDVASVPVISTLYVDSVNGDAATADGSAQAPYTSLTDAMTAAKAGDTLNLASGRYATERLFNFNKMLSFVGPLDRSATLELPTIAIIGIYWGGFTNLTLNTGTFFRFFSGRNLIFRNVEMNMAGTLTLGGNTKLLFDHVLMTSTAPGIAAAISTEFIQNGVNRTFLELRNTTIAGFDLGIAWAQGMNLRIQDSILDNTVSLQGARGFNVWNSLLSDGLFKDRGRNLGGDPLFVDPVSGDYHLQPASPGIDSASPLVGSGLEPNSDRLNMGFYGGTAQATQAQDNDGDGLPDGWETAWGLNPADPLDRLADNDGDGMNNMLEYRFATSPINGTVFVPPSYWLLNSNQLNANIEAMSLVDGNFIAGSDFVRLDQFQTTSIDTVSLGTGKRISSGSIMSLANPANGTDMPVSGWFVGYSFVLPHARNTHRYYLFSPHGDASVRITIDGVEQTLPVPRNQVVEFDAGSRNISSGIVRSNLPLLMSHSSVVGSQVSDVYAVPPASRRISGVYSTSVHIGALEDNTRVSVLDSAGVQTTFLLNAGGRHVLSGGGSAQGQGVALSIVANKPVAAIQVADADGIEATAFWDSIYVGRRYGLPINTQYVAVVCDQASEINLYDNGGAVLATQNCAPAAPGLPGKAYFGSATNGVNIPAGSYLIGSEPFYMIFEASASSDEKNIQGHL